MIVGPRLVEIHHWHRHGENTHLVQVPNAELGAQLIAALEYDNTAPFDVDDKGIEVLPADFRRAQSIVDGLLGAELELRDDEGIGAGWGEVRTVSELYLGGILEAANSLYAQAKLDLGTPRDPNEDEGGVV